jgi:hypothetical protein
VQCANETGSVLIAEGLDSDHDVAAMRAAGIELGHGLRFGRPDLLVRAPVLFDAAGLRANRTATVAVTAAPAATA